MTPDLDSLISHQFANENWMLDGACVGADPEIFFATPGDHDTTKAAVAYCRDCPVRVRCLEWALRTDSAWGVFGATTEKQRRQIKENSDAA